ncbi:MAG TPA: tRNA (N(6)-L-threonylcarbamoyladenosine(37)-C(2))-methylthiotransferase MtaB [Candidatus Omnitrophota bacterium]|nr:tRNA (N(6)-L-threonylcarbamoyladenosine(37)-C(2))-methylthiotransferase MtaB [Candidatus Omnitrophota bacterium]HRZ14846.1 tRNA (N(6)-L-threonylcarbamoyladenosine(37)-C(2))-methylthiotransferase MtaB [Candidatus Omnitrophota bacterium]
MKVKFHTLGCKVNQYETQRIREAFLARGLTEASAADKADIYIVNTCTVTHKADRESLYWIHRSHRENPGAPIIVTGCMAAFDLKLLKAQAGVRCVVGNERKLELPDICRRFLPASRRKRAAAIGPPPAGISFFEGHTRAFLKIQDGCNNRCSYCKVALVRGASRSRSQDEIVDEARQLVAHGFREIVLTGICLGAYGRDVQPKQDLASLIGALETLPGLERVRLSSIEAGDVTPGLIAALAGSRVMCRHLHIPIQSGDDQILKAMRRRYTAADYARLIRRIRKAVPGVAITTDVLVGFPGEEERHFQNTLKLVRAIKPSGVHIFPYSPRPGTAAFGLKEPWAGAQTVKERMRRLEAAAEKLRVAYRKKFLGRTVAVLFESRLKEDPQCWEGHTDTYLKVRLRSRRNLENRTLQVRLTRDCIG